VTGWHSSEQAINFVILNWSYSIGVKIGDTEPSPKQMIVIFQGFGCQGNLRGTYILNPTREHFQTLDTIIQIYIQNFCKKMHVYHVNSVMI